MVNGPGTVILIARLVLARRNSTSRTSTGCLRRILPTMRGTGFGCPDRSRAVPGLSISTPSKRGSEAVGITFAALLSVGDDIQAGTLLVTDREKRCIILCLVKKFRSDAPELPRPHGRGEAARKVFAVDQPIRLGV